MFKKRKDSQLAIDIEPDSVRLVDVVFKRGTPVVNTVMTEALAAGTSETLPERHIAALEVMIGKNRLKTREMVAAVPTNLVITRSVPIDSSKAQPAEEQIRAALQNTLSYDAKELIFDFWPISEVKPGSRGREVLVVAIQRGIVKRYLSGFEKLKLACAHLDVAPCALASLLAKLLPDQGAMVGTIVLSDMMGYFAVLDRQRVLFWRPFELNPKNGPQVNLERIGDEISKCVSHMVGALHMEGMTEIMAFGAAAHDAAFSAYLMSRFNLQVKAPSPFDSLGPGGLSEELKNNLVPAAATQYAAALGLAYQTAGGSIDG